MINSCRKHNEEEYQDLLKQVESTQTRLSSKVEALLIVSQDLAKCQNERDNLRERCQFFEGRIGELEEAFVTRDKEFKSRVKQQSDENAKLQQTLHASRRECERLTDDTQALRQQLEDAHGDIKLLRQKLATYQLQGSDMFKDLYTVPTATVSTSSRNPSTSSANEPAASRNPSHVSSRSSSGNELLGGQQGTQTSPQNSVDDEALEQIERLKSQYSQLERDLRLVLCEKEELVTERDTYKTKCDRMATELSYLMNGDDRKVVTDVDGVLAENRYLKAQIEQAKEETGLARAALNRYRALVERRTTKKASGPGSTLMMDKKGPQQQSQGGTRMLTVVTPKQVGELLGNCGNDDLSTTTDYRALSTALYDAVVDKNLALQHQKKANKILGARITELESRLRALEERSPHRLYAAAQIVTGQRPPLGSDTTVAVPVPSTESTTQREPAQELRVEHEPVGSQTNVAEVMSAEEPCSNSNVEPGAEPETVLDDGESDCDTNAFVSAVGSPEPPCSDEEHNSSEHETSTADVSDNETIVDEERDVDELQLEHTDTNGEKL